MKAILFTALTAISSSLPLLAVDPGQAAPAIETKDVKSANVSLEALKGKVVVLEWINFGCPYVQKHYASGNLPKLQKEYTGKGVVWITINSSAEGKQGYLSAEKMAESSAKQGVAASHIVIDPVGSIGKAYDAKVTPHLYIIDAAGKVAYNGAIDSVPSVKQEDVATAEPWFKNALDAVLAGKEVVQAKNKPYGCPVKY